jgi:hypothetical protein
MTKSQQVFQDMMEYHTAVFTSFKKVHDDYEKDPQKYQQQLNEEGEQVLLIIRKYENILCAHSESGRYGKFSSKTADKFWSFIRKQFPKIDCVGLQ